jgi:hypothetical protein
MIRLVRRVALVLLFCAASSAGSAELVPLDVIGVATGGYWEMPNDRGTFRVTVRNAGFEHVSSEVVAEWISEPGTASGSARLVHSRQLVSPGFYSLGTPVIERRANLVRVTISGVDTHRPDIAVTCVYDLHPDGSFDVVRACGPA